MSAHYSSHYSLPMPVPSKGKGYSYSNYSISPPDADESVSSGGPSFGPSGYSGTASSYAGSTQGDYDSNYSASGVDFEEYMQERFAETFNPLPLERGLAQQAQA